MNKKALYESIMKDVAKIVKKHIVESLGPSLKNRKETVIFGDDEYELCIIWNEDDIRRSAFGMPPEYAYIRKNGKNFADIDVYSNSPDNFAVSQFRRHFKKPEWTVRFNEPISRITFRNILKRLPLE